MNGWKRIGRIAGPANVKAVTLAGSVVRIEVIHSGATNTWVARNFDNHSLLSPLEGFRTMREARDFVDTRWPG